MIDLVGWLYLGERYTVASEVLAVLLQYRSSTTSHRAKEKEDVSVELSTFWNMSRDGN